MTGTAVAEGEPQSTERQIPWWKTGAIYHLYPRSFSDSDGDGFGDLRGVVQRLDHLNDGTEASLGVSAIWLSPIYPSPWRDGGYDVTDHVAIDPRYGSLEDLDALIAACHARDLRIVLDLVLNHTSDLHPWFLASRSSLDDPHRDWYVWRDPARRGGPPNNWRSFFGGPAWTFDRDTGQYYLHTFRPEQPDLNWHNTRVREEALKVVRFWLERGVDGFRLDVFNAYFKHADLLSNPRRLGRTHWTRQRHVHNKDQPELRGLLAELRAMLDEFPDTVAIGETFDGDPELAASYCDLLHMAFNFHFLEQPWDADAMQRSIARWDRLLSAEHEWPCYVLSNHDRPRHASRFAASLSAAESDARAKVAAALLLTLRGTPFIYYGEEIGMSNVDVSQFHRWDDYWENGSTRDRSRTPMQWNADRHAGFTSGTPWLPVAQDFAERNVVGQAFDGRSVLSFYRRLLWLRRSTPALQVGDWTPLIDRPRSSLLYLRRVPEQTVLVALNLSERESRVRLPRSLPRTWWTPRISTRRPDVEWRIRLADEIALRPYEATIFELMPG